MSKRKSKVSGVIDVALTRNYHDYYGEEEDPGPYFSMEAIL